MTMMIPRLRGDLKATPVEDSDGVLYYDISDPKTGGTLRLFDFEWLLAQRLNGQQSYPDLARWTEEQFGFSTTSRDLEAYGSKLLDLGVAEAVAAALPAPAVVEPVKPVVAEPAPPAPVEQAKPAVSEPVRTKPVGADDGDDVMGRPVITLPASRPAAKPATQPEVKAVPAAKPSEPAALPEPPQAKPAEPAVAAAPPVAVEAKPAVAQAPAAVEAKPAIAPPPVQKPAEPAQLAGSPTAQLEPVPPPTDTKTVPLATVAAPSATTPVTTDKPAPTAPSKAAEVAPSATTPVGTTKPSQPEQGGGAGKWIIILLVLAAAVGAAYYFLVYMPKMHPPAVGVRMNEAKPETLPRKFAVPAQVKPAEPVNLKIDADGEVASIVEEKAEVTPETVLVELATKAKLEKELADARKLTAGLQKKAETGKGKAKADAQAKLDEKQKRIAELEGLIKKTTLNPARPGTVAKVLVKKGDAVTAGTDVVAITDKALAAELRMPAMEAQGLKVGDEVKLLAETGTISAQVLSLKPEGDQTTVQFILPADAKAKDGDKLNLVRGTLEGVVRLPNTALVEGGKVYVVKDGKASLRTVTVADRDGESVLVQGLTAGDQIVVSRVAELHEGTAVTAATAP